MNVSSFTTNTILRDPYLIKHLNDNQFRENLHKGFLRFTFLIKRVYGPFTPEPESEEEEEPPPKPKPKKPSKVWVSNTKKASQSKDQGWKTMLSKYKGGANKKSKAGKPQNKKYSKKPTKGSVKLPSIKKTKGDDTESSGPGVDKQRVRYIFRYSQSLDMYKQQRYEELLRKMGVDPNSVDITKIDFSDIDDPTLLEVNLDWCRVGTFVEDSRPATSYQTQCDDVTEGDRYSVLFGQSRAKSVISLVSERSSLGTETPAKLNIGNIPRLPPIGER
jgi:hypothetical protein